MDETIRYAVDQFELDSFEQPAVALMLESQRNDTEFPVHTHRKGQLVVAYHGGIVCTVEDGVWMVPSGFGVWIPGGIAHSNRVTANGKIGYRPEISVADVEAGKADPWFDLYGKD